MKKILLIVTLLVVMLEAKIYKSSEAYFEQGGKKTQEIIKLLETDKYYKEGNEYLLNKIERTVKIEQTQSSKNSSDGVVRSNKVSIPQWDKALESFIKSATINQNPVSAFQGLYIINSFYGKKQRPKDFNTLSKVLFEHNKSSCQSYLNYGEIFERGLYTKVDNQKALDIYSEGLESKKCSGWEVSVLSSKIFRLKLILKISKNKK